MLGPVAPGHSLEVMGNPRVSQLAAGQPPALTFNTGCTWDFQWMRVSLWSCENLGGQQRLSRKCPPAHPLGAGKWEGAGTFHTTKVQ